ncbi:bifunctional nuclease family protein [Methanolobus sp.]|jgi:bifunctional DNase/RNase|uniref:bifunctional nuclease family protein n=1 Tax=Methanolobus sp. TaxID=1874737 RepID=UPI0025CF06A1|nr:bifunctional nuclease family protein [Methanolobus sp.]
MNSASKIKEVTVKGVFMINIFGRAVPAVMLEDEEGLMMPIHIGQSEALSINSVMKNETMPRPMTHDLIVAILTRLDAEVERVLIDEKIDNIYYARITLKKDGTTMEFDARPSDCIAIALRNNASIMINEDVFSTDAISKENFLGSKAITGFV